MDQELDNEVSQLTQAICRLHRRRMSAKNAIQTLKEEGFGEVSIEYVKSIYEQRMKQLKKRILPWSVYAEKSVYWTTAEKGDVTIWSERYILFHKSDSNRPFYEIKVLDCYNDKSMQVEIEKVGDSFVSIHSLDDNFGLLVERTETHELFFGVSLPFTVFSVTLIYLDLYAKKCEKFEKIDFTCDRLRIIVNKAEPTEFAINTYGPPSCIHLGKVDEHSMNLYELDDTDFPYQGYFDRRFYKLELNDYEKLEVTIDHLKKDNREQFELELPGGYRVIDDDCDAVSIRDRAFIPLKVNHGGIVISYVDVQSRQWNIIEFAPSPFFQQMNLFNENELIIQTYEKGKFNFYKLCVRKPDRLQNMAWMALIKVMKKRKTLKDPYEAARRYLPYNSQIRCPFVKPDPNEKAMPKQKHIKLG